jgi:hypothetical protein
MNLLFKEGIWCLPKKQIFIARVLWFLLFISLASLSFSQPPRTLLSQPEQGSPKSPPCSSYEYKQFDFWVGDWDSFDAKGVIQGHNLVEKILGGCVLQEYWMGTDGARGTSFSLYDATRKVWNQTWVSNHGNLLPIEGYLQGKSLILTGTHVGADGRVELHRTIWTPTDYGVYQLWDFSKDGGKTWETNYEGFLRKAKTPFSRADFDKSK